MLSLGAAALAAVPSFPPPLRRVMAIRAVDGTVATVGTATGMAVEVYVGPRYGGCWAPGYDWVPCRRWWW